MGLSFNEFKTLKAENRIRWDTDSLNKGADEVRSYISSVSDQSQFKGNQWTDDEYNNNRAQAAGMRNRLRALEVYANSLKDKDEGAYRNAMSAHSQLSGALDQVDDWFRSNEGDAFKSNWENYRQADKAQKLTKGIDQMRAGSTAKEQAAALGLDEKELETAYKEQRDYEKQEDLVNRFGGMSYDELLGVINDPKRNAQRIVGEVDQYYKNLHNWENESEQDMELALKTAAERNNLSVEQVREIYNGGKEMHNRAIYASDALSNDDTNYIFSRIIESGSAEQLEQLKKDLPSGKHYDKLRNSINLAIEEKKEQRYFLDVKEKFPEIDKLIETKENGDEFYRQGFNEEQDPEGFKEYDKANKLLSVYEKMGVDVDKYKRYKDNYKNRLVNDMFQQVVSVAADKHPVLTSLASTPVNMIGSLGDVPKVIRAAFDDDYYYDPKGTASYTASNIRSTVSRKIDNPGWEFLYNSGMSMSDSAIGIAANYIPVVGQFVSSAMFFSSAGVSAANEVVENGGTPAQAAWTMLAHGGAELVFEKISLEKLNALQAAKNVKGAKQIITNILKQSFTESSEEVATTLANTLTDQIINGDLSAFSRNKQAYIDEGLSEKEATAKAVTDWWASLGMDAAGGAFSGGVFGALGSTKAHLSYRSAMKNTTVTLGGVEMSAKDALKAAPEHFHNLAQDLVEKEGFDVKQLTEIAKDASEDGKARTLADSIERTIRESGKEKITAADVENLLNELYKENIDAHTTGEHIKSALAWTEMDSLTGAEQKKTAVKEFNDSFDLAGKRKAGDPSAASDAAPPTQGSIDSVSSFGKAHPNGIAAFDKSGKEITVKGVDSVVNEYGKGDRTVSFVLGDGSVADADEVEFTDPDMQQLVELAKSYDTIGARALLSNYEDAKANGVSLETYKDAFAALYDVGQNGTDYEYAVKNPKYEATMQQIGAQAAQAAIEAGNYDADQSAKTQSFMSKRVRVKGRTLNESRVRVERGVTAEISDDLKPVLQLLAEKTGKEIVVTNAMDAEDKGVYSDNRIYLNAAHLSDASVTTALHEAVHNMAAYSAEDFRTLEKFVMNYYAETGVDVDKLKDKIKATYGQDAPTPRVVREEIVAKAVESIVSDEKALRTALECKANKGLIEKIGDILKRIVDFVSKYFKGDKANGLLKHNEYAQAFLDNSEKLQQMAEIISRGFENAKANEQTYGSRESGARFSHAGNTADSADRSLLQQTQQFKRWFDNSKVVDKDGKPLVVYHQTDADFTVFNTDSNGAGRYDDETPSGIFLKPSDNDIGLKGKKQMALYASIKNPLTVRNREELVRFYEENVDGYEEKKAALRYIDTEYSAKYEEASKRADEEYAAMHRKLRKKEITREEYDNFAKKEGEEERVIKEWEQAGNKASAELKALVTQFFKNSDYDGIIIEQDAGSFGRSTKTFIALDNTQVKSATDNIGTFDKSNPDIRYSKDDTIYDIDLLLDNGEDIQDTIRRNPQAAVELIYRNAVDYMQKSFESAGDVVLTDKEIADIAKNMFERLGIDETAGQLSGKGLTFEQRIENFVNQINRINGSNSKYKSDLYRSAFEGLATSLTQYVEALKSTDLYNERQSIYGFIGNRALKLRTDGMPDIELIRRNYGKIDNYRRRVGGKFRVGYEGRVNNGFTIDELIDYVKENHPQLVDDELINRDGGFMWAERLVNQTLGEKIKVGDSGYYEDTRSAALEAAMGVASDIMAAQKSGESTAGLPVKVTELRRELRKAKRQISELNKRGTVEDKSIKKAVRDEYAKAVRANNDINVIKSIASKMRTMIVNPTDKKFIPEEFLNNTDFLDAFEDVANAVVVNDYSKVAERFAAMVDQLQDMREKAVDKDGDFSEAFDDAFMSDLRNVLKAVKDIDTEGKQGRESRKAKLIGELEKLLDTALNGEQFTKQQYRDILDVIHAVEQNDDFDISMLNALQKKLGSVNFENNFAEISKTLSPRKVSRKHLNDKELHQMREALEQVMWRIENARKQLFREDSITHQESGERMIEQIRGLSKHKRKAISRVFAGIDDNFLNPIRLADKAMQYSKDSELQYHINATNEGWRKMTFWAMNAEKAFAELVTQNEKAYKKACNEVISVEYDAKTEVNGKTLTTSKTLEMTRMEAMYLLMAWKREQLSRNMEHLTTGGIVVADPKMEAKGKGKAFEKAAQHLVSKEMIEAVSKYMGDFERSYMRLAENYFNKTAKDAINEVMMAIKHREIARSEYYVPIRVDRDFLNVELDGLKYDAVIENRGSYKETVRSDKPVLVMSLNKIIENHINETAQLYGLAIPLRNFKKALNINIKGKMTEKGWQSPDSVRTAMTAQMGQRAVTVFNRLIEDLNRPRKTDTNKVFSALYQARVKTALVGNFGVVIKQAASYTNAGLYLSAKDLTAGIGKFFLGEKEDGKRFAHFYQKTINEIDKYTGQHYIRRKGMSVQEVADMMNRSKLTRKTPSAINPVKWIQAMDCATTAALWEAVKTHVNTEYKKSGKAVGTAEFFEDVADLYNKVIENTQPMYDPLHRCEFQKSSGDFMKSVFMFTTQPLQNFGILYDAAARFISDKNAKNAQHLAKAVSSQFSSLLVFSLMTFVAALLRHKWDRYRDENDDITVESFLRTYWGDVFTNAVNNAAPIGGDYGLAIKDDLVNWIGKGDNSLSGVKDKASITLVNDYLTRFSKAAKALSNGKWSFWNVADVPGSLSEFFGVPYNNLSTMFKGAESNIKELATGVPVSNGGELKTDNIKNNIIRNYLNGDSDKADKLTDKWINQRMSEGRTEEKAVEYIEEKLAEGLAEMDDVALAAEAKFDGRLTEHKQIKEKYVEFGAPESVFDKAVTKLINKMDNGEDSGEEEEAEPTVKSDYTYKDAVNALVNATESDFETARQELIDTMIANGKAESEEEAAEAVDKKLRSFSYTKDLFADYHSVSGEKFYKAKAALEKLYGDDLKAKYEDYVKKYVDKQQ